MVKRFVILGGGITGLSLAWYLKKKWGDTAKITLLEKSHRVGGWIQTIEKEGFVLDQGPRSCRSAGNGAYTLQLIEELGLQEEIIFANPSAHKRFLYQDQQLKQLPSGFLSFLFSSFSRKLFPAIMRDLFTSAEQEKEETIDEFVKRRFSNMVAEELMDPLVSGIYAGDIQKLSLRSCFPTIYEAEQAYGSVFLGMLLNKQIGHFQENSFIKNSQKNSLFSFKNGMEVLTKELGRQLKDCIVLSTYAEELRFKPDFVELILSNGELLEADHLFCALPSLALADLIKPHSLKAFEILNGVPNSSVAVVSMGFKKSVLKHSGFGYLVPSKEREKILGMVWDSCVFPQQNRKSEETRLTVMMGGSTFGEILALHENSLHDMALKTVKKHLDIQETPDVLAIKIAKEAIPQYLVGHQDRVVELKKELQAYSLLMTLTGSLFGGVAVNDCIKYAYQTAKNSDV